jgi:hypothetical protein
MRMLSMKITDIRKKHTTLWLKRGSLQLMFQLNSVAMAQMR